MEGRALRPASKLCPSRTVCGWTVKLLCKGCGAGLSSCSLDDTILDLPRAGAAADWRLFLASALPPTDALAHNAVTAEAQPQLGSLRCARCGALALLVDDSSAPTVRWRAALLGEAVRLEADADAETVTPLPLVDGGALVELWSARAAARFLIDLRPASEFAARHLAGSTNIPWAGLDGAVSQLPVAAEPVLVLAPSELVGLFLAFAVTRGRGLAAIAADSAALWAAAADADRQRPPGSPRLVSSKAAGSFSARAWAPSPMLEAHEPALRPKGEAARARPLALDLGCGSGRDAVFLATCGWDVVAVDSDARALARTEHLAASARVALVGDIGAPSPSPDGRGRVQTLLLDLEAPGSGCTCALELLARPQLVVFVRYLNRPLLEWARERVDVGGVVAIAHFLRGAELVGRMRPRDPADLLERGELARLFVVPGQSAGFRADVDDEHAQAEDGRPMVHYAARRRSSLADNALSLVDRSSFLS
jgi:SAM-dependent methyltransferase